MHQKWGGDNLLKVCPSIQWPLDKPTDRIVVPFGRCGPRGASKLVLPILNSWTIFESEKGVLCEHLLLLETDQ